MPMELKLLFAGMRRCFLILLFIMWLPCAVGAEIFVWMINLFPYFLALTGWYLFWFGNSRCMYYDTVVTLRICLAVPKLQVDWFFLSFWGSANFNIKRVIICQCFSYTINVQMPTIIWCRYLCYLIVARIGLENIYNNQISHSLWNNPALLFSTGFGVIQTRIKVNHGFVELWCIGMSINVEIISSFGCVSSMDPM